MKINSTFLTLCYGMIIENTSLLFKERAYTFTLQAFSRKMSVNRALTQKRGNRCARKSVNWNAFASPHVQTRHNKLMKIFDIIIQYNVVLSVTPTSRNSVYLVSVSKETTATFFLMNSRRRFKNCLRYNAFYPVCFSLSVIQKLKTH